MHGVVVNAGCCCRGFRYNHRQTVHTHVHLLSSSVICTGLTYSDSAFDVDVVCVIINVDIITRDDARLTFVCLSVAYIGPNSRTERPRKTKIGPEVAHVTRDSDTTFKVKRSKVNLQGAGAYCGGLLHSLLLSTLTT